MSVRARPASPMESFLMLQADIDHEPDTSRYYAKEYTMKSKVRPFLNRIIVREFYWPTPSGDGVLFRRDHQVNNGPWVTVYSIKKDVE